MHELYNGKHYTLITLEAYFNTNNLGKVRYISEKVLPYFVIRLPNKFFSHWLKLPAKALYKAPCLIVLAKLSSCVCEHSDVIIPKLDSALRQP